MTSLSTIGAGQQHVEGRTVRDIVEYSPGQVNEVWCRKILRQVLQSLELQYAMRMAHRPITPDTIVFHGNGEPLLVPTEGAEPEGREADDLHALACVIHYAITQELIPTGPLLGRAPAGYGDALLAAIDRCMAPDPAARPQTIEALRNLLGIVPLGPPPGAIAVEGGAIPGPRKARADPAPVAMAARLSHPSPSDHAPAAAGLAPSLPDPRAKPRGIAALGRWQRWALAGGIGALLLALVVVVFTELRDTGSFDHVVLTLPQESGGAQPATDAPAPTAGADAPAPSAPDPAPVLVPVPVTGGTPVPGVQVNPGHHEQVAAATVPAGGATYKLQIKPWGIVYVDDVDKGVSPPVKRLVLPPGKHMIRVANPNFQERALQVDTSEGDAVIGVDFNEDIH
jgi:hypothetical protein